MDVIMPLPETKAHVYYDESSGAHQVIERGEIELHHEHVVFDTKDMSGLSAKDRERLLEIRAELVDRDDAIARLKAMTRERIEKRLGPDDEIIRLDALMRDVVLSMNRIASRAARLKEVEAPFEARRARDVDATIRLLGGDPTGQVLASLEKEKDRLTMARDTLLEDEYPYLSRIATPAIASQLLSLVGGIKSLASAPASKIQLLGAEAALFRHLKNKKQRPPKHGVIHEHPLMQRVPKKYRGRFARQLGDKIAIAARVDYFGNAERKDIETTWNALETSAEDLKTK